MPTSRDDAGGDVTPPIPTSVRNTPALPPDDDVILLEDLAPRAEVKGGRVSRVFGIDGDSEPDTLPADMRS